MSCQHPGKILLRQYLQPQEISQNKLARAIKVPPRRINEIIHEKRGISADTSVRLAIYFGGSASYWMHLQAEFDIEKVKKNITIQLSTILPAEQSKPITTDQQPKAGAPQEKAGHSLKKRIMR
jgi:addiction module HigA family antidote